MGVSKLTGVGKWLRSFFTCDKDVFASQKRIIVDPQSTGYPIPYLIDSGKVEKISVYASTYMERQNFVLMNPETGFRNAL